MGSLPAANSLGGSGGGSGGIARMDRFAERTMGLRAAPSSTLQGPEAGGLIHATSPREVPTPAPLSDLQSSVLMASPDTRRDVSPGTRRRDAWQESSRNNVVTPSLSPDSGPSGASLRAQSTGAIRRRELPTGWEANGQQLRTTDALPSSRDARSAAAASAAAANAVATAAKIRPALTEHTWQPPRQQPPLRQHEPLMASASRAAVGPATVDIVPSAFSNNAPPAFGINGNPHESTRSGGGDRLQQRSTPTLGETAPGGGSFAGSPVSGSFVGGSQPTHAQDAPRDMAGTHERELADIRQRVYHASFAAQLRNLKEPAQPEHLPASAEDPMEIIRRRSPNAAEPQQQGQAGGPGEQSNAPIAPPAGGPAEHR